MTIASLSTLSSVVAVADKRSILSCTSLSFTSHCVAKVAHLRAAVVPWARRVVAAIAVSASTVVATFAVGDKVHDTALSYFDPVDVELKTVTLGELTSGKKVVLLVVPGAFTMTCSQKQLPGFMEKASELRAKGVEMDLSGEPMGLSVRSLRYALLIVV